MATIRYTKTFFNEPSRINEEAYNAIKSKLIRNPNFEIDPNPETFSEHFSGHLKIIKVCGIIIFICLITAPFSDVLAIPAFLVFLVIVFSCIPLLLEGPSFATYLKKKRDYFSRMKYAIQNTSSYFEFCKSFYGK